MRLLWVAVGVLTLFRLVVAASVGLGDAEAYYWTWSQHLDWSYYDHGPVVAWSIAFGTWLMGDTTLGVRVPFVAYGALLLIAAADLTKRIFDAGTALFTLAILLTMPMLLVAGGAANPDVPFTLLVMLFLLSGRRIESQPTLPLLGLTALLAGLATSTKLFGLALWVPLVWLLGSRFRRSLRALLIAAVSLLVGLVPLLVWNLQHDWASLRYHLLLRHGESTLGFSLVNLLKLVGGQLGYVGPITCVALLAAAVHARRAWHKDWNTRLLLLTSLPLLGGGMLLILVVPSAEPHWPAAGYLPLVPLLAEQLASAWDRRSLRMLSILAASLGGLVFLLFHLHVMTDLGVRLAPAGYVARYDISNELHGWPRIADAVMAELSQRKGSTRPVAAAACHYTSCSQLSFAAHGRFEVLCPSPRISQFDFFPGGDGQHRQPLDLLYLWDERFPFAADTLYRCGKIERARTIELRRANRVVRRFAVDWCRDFRGLRAKHWPPRTLEAPEG